MKIIYASPNEDLNEVFANASDGDEIRLKSGVYRQKVCLSKSLRVVGEDRDKTIITFDDYAKKIHADGKEYNTFRTYTFCVCADGVVLENLTVENSNTHPEEVGQCVALSVHGDAFYAKNVVLRSTQDTLFLSPFPDDLVVRYDGFIPKRQLYKEGKSVHLFEDCEIYGTVDYVFGCAEGRFYNCKFVNVYDKRGTGFVAAPAHCLSEENGFCFVSCEFLSDGAGESTVYLARPWRDFGKCTFIDCKLGKHVKSELFDKWNDTYRDKTARFEYFNLSSEIPLSPVSWATELNKAQADIIIKAQKEKFLKIKK